MIIWVMYDVSIDKARTKIAKHCKQAGLYRVQYSVFLGEMDKNQRDVLQLQIEALIEEEQDKVYLFPMSKKELRESVLLGQAFDKKLVTNEVKALFL